MTRVEVKQGLPYAFILGGLGAGLSAAAQYLNAPGWVFIAISVIAFPLVGVSAVIQVPVAVIAGYLLGVEGGVAVTAVVLFLFFTSVAFGQACVWFQVRLMRAASKGTAAGKPEPGTADGLGDS